MVSVVLLGAGASYGSIDVTPHVPPLGNDPDGLFSKLEKHSTLAASLPNDLKETFRNNFEAGMAEYRKSFGDNTIGFQRDLAAYLAQFTPGEKNAYRKLVSSLGINRVVYSTLNYDLLFELSAAALGLNTHYGLDKITKAVRLLKLHGSCNFWPDIPVGMFQGATFSGNATDVSASVRPLNQEQTIKRCREDDSLSPAIALYADGKPVKVCPEYIRVQQDLWKATVLRAHYVFISGVRVHPVDSHIWNPLAQTSATVMYFGLGQDEKDFLDWKENARAKSAHFFPANFWQSIEVIGKRLG